MIPTIKPCQESMFRHVWLASKVDVLCSPRRLTCFLAGPRVELSTGVRVLSTTKVSSTSEREHNSLMARPAMTSLYGSGSGRVSTDLIKVSVSSATLHRSQIANAIRIKYLCLLI